MSLQNSNYNYFIKRLYINYIDVFFALKNPQLRGFFFLRSFVASLGFEPKSKGYEPFEIPLL